MKLTKHQQKVVDRIKELHAAGQPLNIDAVREREPKLLAAAYMPKKFWGWLQALEAAGLTYDDIRISLMHQVQCKICKGWYGALSGHIRTHDMTTEEYCEKFPRAPMMSQRIRADRTGKRSKKTKVEVSNWEPLWSREYILDKAAFYYRHGYNISAINLQAYDVQLYKISLKYWGEWDSVLVAIGLDPARIRLVPVPLNPYKTKKDVIAEIQRRHSVGLDLNTNAVSKGEDKDLALYNRGRRVFGNWKAAVEESGMKYDDARKNRSRYPDRKSLIAAIRERHAAGKAINCISIARGPDCDHAMRQAIGRYYGSVEKACRAAGVRFRKARESKYPDEKSVLKEIKRRVKIGLPVTPSVLAGKSPGPLDRALLMRGSRFFGSWRNAVESAGIEYEKKVTCCHSALKKHTSAKAAKKALLKIVVRKDGKYCLPEGPLCLRKVRGLRTALDHYCGSYVQAIAELNSPVKKRGNPWVDFSEDELIKELKLRKRKGLSLNYRAVVMTVPHLAETVCEYVGSWKTALERAGFKYKDYTRLRYTDVFPDKDSVLREIRRRHDAGISNRSESVREGKHSDSMLYAAARHYHGTFFKAVKKAGVEVEYKKRKIKRFYPAKKDVINEIRRRADKDLTLSSAILRRGKRSERALFREASAFFGGWSLAIEAAGVKPRRRKSGPASKYPTPESVIAEMKSRHSRGRSLVHTHIKTGKWKDHSLARSSRKFFGNIINAVEAAGLQYPEIKSTDPRRYTKYTTAELVVDAIRNRHNKGIAVNAKDLRYGENRDPELYFMVLRLFGSIRAALDAAGLHDTLAYKPRSRYPDKESVMTAIRRLHAQGVYLGRSSVGNTLYLRARHFWGSWRAAVEAAGLEYPDSKKKKNRS